MFGASGLADIMNGRRCALDGGRHRGC